MSVPEAIVELVERFERNRQDYVSDSYNEARLREEFINPFFEALGWDMRNRAGYAENYKDVIHEDAIKIGGDTKAPDYCFRIGGTRKFFVEAKKPSVNVREDSSPAYQLRRYAWSAKLPLSIVTDFEEFAVYDCRVKPSHTDKASTARTIYLTCKDYSTEWDKIASIFSRDAILMGSFDKYAESGRAKRGTAEVDDAFLKDIEAWREMLARNLALRNARLTSRELNFAVQRIIDRIIFLRICEDRHYEDYGSVRVLLNGSRVYPRLAEMFRAADDRYNSGLFHFHQEKARAEGPDELTLALEIDDKPLKDIIKSLYYPDSPYEFSVLPADILGQVYEQFLGKVIRLTAGHQAKVEDKPEVKKAGGVYYTPTYIVDYIVKNTVGKLVDGKTPKQVEKLRVLDPACGSGSFLIGAYQYLLDWHRDWYLANDPAKWSKARNARIYQAERGEWRLTNAERKRILLANIYGVDIDSQAVEVTKLSLLLKILEGGAQLAMGGERMLPDLGGNIKCGNSLIGPDFYAGQQMTLLGDEERLRINVFDWESEFPEIMKSGGFDAVIGNPPWGGDIDSLTGYIERSYPASAKGYKDTSKLFIDKGIQLLSPSGHVGFIVPSAFMFQPRYVDVRSLLRQLSIRYLWNIGDRVFGAKVTAPCCVFVAQNNPASPEGILQVLDTSHERSNPERASMSRNPSYVRTEQRCYDTTASNAFVGFHREPKAGEISLEHVLDCKDCGIKHQRVGCGLEEKGKSDLAKRLYYQGEPQSPTDHPFLIGADLRRHGWYIDTSAPRFFRDAYKDVLRGDEIVYFNKAVFELPQKIVWRQTNDRLRATIIGPSWFANTLQAGVPRTKEHDIRYILGILNSTYLGFLYVQSVQEEGRAFPQVKLAKVRALPFRPINFSDPSDKARHDRMVGLVEQMLALHKRLADARLEQEKTAIQRQIDGTDRQIDALVYELYELTDEEIAIVEGR